MEILFWISLFLVIYIYAGYAGIIWLISRFFPEPKYEELKQFPKVSLIIAAYNEEKIIEKKIQNSLDLDYPEDCIEILIGADGSTDRTGDILRAINNPRIKTFVWDKRYGKIWTLNRLCESCTGEFLVFTDANVLLDKQAVTELITPFQDSTIGAVIGNLMLYTDISISRISSEQRYWFFENMIRKNETRIGNAFGMTGALYAMRKFLFEPIPEAIPVADDTHTVMKILEKRYRTVYREKARAYEEIIDDMFVEARRRIRICAANLNGVKYYARLLNPLRGYTALGILSHKLLRWIAPILLLILLITSAVFSAQPLYRAFLYGELVFILCSSAGILLYYVKVKVKYIPYCAYFVVVNGGLLIGFFKFFFGLQKPYWETTNRVK